MRTPAHSIFEHINATCADFRRIRQDIHANPELGLETVRTAELVARELHAYGIAVYRGIGGHGVVGVLRSGSGVRTIGLRADMDALPLEEETGVAYRSTSAGLMHACGHDGHTTMLLAAANYLAKTRKFDGTVNFIFQPGEEGAGGALAMIDDALFERFPCECVFGLHNRPGMAVGYFGVSPGPAMSGGGIFDIDVVGKGSHAARPEEAIDPVLTACHIGTALQSIVARNVSAFDMAVLSITRIRAGEAYNVIPETASLSGTVRAMRPQTLARVEEAMRRLVGSVATSLGASATFQFKLVCPPLVNHDGSAHAIADAAAEIVGSERVDRAWPPVPASEDFSFMLERVPGAFMNVGNGTSSAPVHNNKYDFNDEAIPYGAAVLARLVERTCKAA